MFKVQHQLIEPICVPVEGTEQEGYSKAYINKHILVENGGQYIATFRCQPEARTVIEVVRGSSVKYPNQPCVGERVKIDEKTAGDYKFLTYKEFYERALAFGRSVLELGLHRGDRVGIYSQNSIWWQTIFVGCASVGVTPVPVYDSLGPDAAEFILNQAEVKVLFTSKAKLDNSITLLQNASHITHLCLLEGEFPEVEHTVEFIKGDDLLELGRKSTKENKFASPEDTALLMYTSGSTGKPKGCIITHGNVIAGAAGFSGLGVSATTTDVFLSFLPLAHIYALVVEVILLAQGSTIGYSQGDIKLITDDMKALKPTIIVAVPRVLNRVYDKMKSTIATMPAIVQKIVNMAIANKVKNVWRNDPSSLLLDMTIFKKFREGLGGRLRLIVNGGAPIMKDVFEFISATVTPNIIQGYGLTETTAGVAVQEAPAKDPATVGPCGYSCMVRMRAVPGTSYDARGEFPKGELQVKGPIVFKGYYQRDDLNAEVFDDGWFCTGDVVKLTENYELQIIDRAKQLVKLSQGEYLSLTQLSEKYMTRASDAVQFVYVYANSMHDRPVALVIPAAHKLREWRNAGKTDEEIKNGEEVRQFIMEALNAAHKAEGMRGFERISKLLIDTVEPSVENKMLTPSQKPQYNTLKAMYEQQLLALYE